MKFGTGVSRSRANCRRRPGRHGQKREKFGPKQVLLAEGITNPSKGDTALNYRWVGANMVGSIVPAFAAAFGAETIGMACGR